jgi:hypothetical protein
MVSATNLQPWVFQLNLLKSLVAVQGFEPCTSALSTDFPKITSEAYPIILHLAKILLLKGNVIPNLSQKGLHILHASRDVPLDVFNLALGYRKPIGLVEREVILDDPE